ncbi:MAG: RNA polymerase sigma factor, partial [Acidobacteriota bacterium]
MNEKGIGIEDESTFVEKAKQGDRDAFMELIKFYQQKVYRLAYSILQNREDVLDVVQETLVRVHEKIHLYRRGNNFQAWIFQITKNLCVDHYRKNIRKRQQLEADFSLNEDKLAGGNSSDDKRSTEIKKIFSSCLEKLSPRQRLVFAMKHFNGFCFQEIAQTLGIAQGTVKSLHFKALQN